MNKMTVKAYRTNLTAKAAYERIKAVYPESAFLSCSYKSSGSCCRSYIGCDVFLKFRSRGRRVEIITGKNARHIAGNPLAILDGIVKKHRTIPAARDEFTAGGIGYFSYGLKNLIEKLPSRAVDDLSVPDIYFNFFSTILIFDENDPGIAKAHFLEPYSGRSGVKKMLEGLFRGGGAGAAKPANNLRIGWPSSNFTEAGYVAAVKKVKSYIKKGDIFQACISQRFDASFAGDPWQLYLMFDSINPAPYSAYLDLDGMKVISSSPELFLKAAGGRIETRPMKGTIRRGRNRREDAVLKKRLAESGKDAAELSMIVDLERNDLGKICVPGSVEVKNHRRLEKYATVFQTTSLVRGKLKNPGMNVEEIIRAAFPGGSISGCPKIRAMEIIDEIEPVARGVYTGSVGYISFHKTMGLNIAIRSGICKNGKIYYHAGGGIVADSDPEKEYRETLVKAGMLIAGIAGCRRLA